MTEQTEEAQAVAVAAERSVRWITASDAAVARHQRLVSAGLLGSGMALPARQRRAERQESPSQPHAAPATIKPVNMETQDGLAELAASVERLERGPTVERRAMIETQLEIYTTTVQAGRNLASEAWRVVPVVEHMARRGQLSQEDVRAAERFYRDFVLGHRVGGLISRYGDQAGSGGTPISQLATALRKSPDELRAEFHQLFIDAARAINHLPTVEWMVRILCEQIMAAEAKPPTLTDAGRGYMGYKDPKQNQAVGATLIKTGLQRLARHYG